MINFKKGKYIHGYYMQGVRFPKPGKYRPWNSMKYWIYAYDMRRIPLDNELSL